MKNIITKKRVNEIISIIENNAIVIDEETKELVDYAYSLKKENQTVKEWKEIIYITICNGNFDSYSMRVLKRNKKSRINKIVSIKNRIDLRIL